ncbi:hypothetical protein Nepgr_020591 [Nepenthes gracilis]|uniref:Cation/H+ exchanger domain-containing protein n=1 Tax=Nepenthes gracilis TaxID=150966 RepID=A0AAD3XWE8_NEPGR|nr:hypothetical protein Nepgr_020591 [Nepenthes gracilis]
MLWLLLASVIFVPVFQKIPGGSPILGYLAAGILIGPYGLSIIHHVHGTKTIAEFGVMLFAIANNKYCKRHMNRGSHSSRKHVEGQTGHSVSRAITPITKLAAVSFVHQP